MSRSARASAITWVVGSLAWATVMVATDHVAWPLVGWVVTTFGPLAARPATARGPERPPARPTDDPSGC